MTLEVAKIETKKAILYKTHLNTTVELESYMHLHDLKW